MVPGLHTVGPTEEKRKHRVPALRGLRVSQGVINYRSLTTKAVIRAMPACDSLLCAHHPASAPGGPGARHTRTPGFYFLPSKTSQLTNHPGEKMISSFKTVKHFEKVKPLPRVQSANNSVQEEAVLGKVRGRREVVRRLERLPGEGNCQGLDGKAEAAVQGAMASSSPLGLLSPQDGGHLGLMVTFSPAGLPSLGGGSVNIKGKSMGSQQPAQGFLSGWGRQPASTSQGSLMRPKRFDQ